MSPLKNARHERFAQALAKGLNATQAYLEAGYEAQGNSAEAAASRLLRDVKVQARLAEMQNKAAAKTEITVAKLTEMYLEDRKLARDNVQTAAAVSAVTALGKLHGLIIDQSKSETTVRYVARAEMPAKTMDEWLTRVGKPNGNGATIPDPTLQ